ncbi:uncharacterized protein LOC126969281 [Leptidea sinapis]|uniref:uncharacterized protein LOC126969281 n=1 Tax=Leptidea sinapis TaxID=189913 RepID=UPI0021C409C3|nr:uncharacterized protein LOC126969281 [Leptidea sinapis]
MYTDENSDRECEFEEFSPDDSPNVTKKSLSTAGFRNNIDNPSARPMALRATQSLTGTVDELKLCGNFQMINLNSRVNMTQTPKAAPICPCGCLLRPAITGPFRTREKNTYALHVVSPEVLTHHGYNFEPTQIAMFWKKDCRMFLWKGRSKRNCLQSETK